MAVKVGCGCHCIRCGSTALESGRVGKVEEDGYFDMHHTCMDCNAHFDHLDGETFDRCERCGYGSVG